MPGRPFRSANKQSVVPGRPFRSATETLTPRYRRPPPEVRSKMAALSTAMKSCVAKALTWADPEEPGSEALSKALLAPLVNWKDIPFRSKGEAGETDHEEDNTDTPS